MKQKYKRYSNLIFHKDIIKSKKLLSKLKYHDCIKYNGPLILFDGTKLGEDYEFHDKFYNDWDSPRAFIFKSKTRIIMEQIISILEKHQVPVGFYLTKFNWYIKKN